MVKQDLKWTNEDLEYLYLNYIDANFDEMIERLGRKKHSIVAKANFLGLKRERYWTDEEIEFLEDNYAHMDYDELCSKLGKSKRCIQDKAYKLGITKNWTIYEENY